MKLLKFILIFCCLSVCLITQPQNYIKPGSSWFIYWINEENAPYITGSDGFETGNEITIEGKNYLEIRDGRGFFAGGIREEEGKIYAWIESHGEDAKDFLLCDFTAETGDIIQTNCPAGSLKFPVMITKTDSITLLNGKKRKRLFTDMGTEWIEGIGSTKGLFYEAIPFIASYDVPHLIYYYENEETLLYLNKEWCLDCPPDKKQEITTDPDIHLYPNPTTGAVNFSLPVGLSCSSVSIYSQEGKLIQSFPIKADSQEVSMDVSYLQAGIYYVELDGQNPKQTYKMIKIQ